MGSLSRRLCLQKGNESVVISRPSYTYLETHREPTAAHRSTCCAGAARSVLVLEVATRQLAEIATDSRGNCFARSCHRRRATAAAAAAAPAAAAAAVARWHARDGRQIKKQVLLSLRRNRQ